ncbi:MAG: energy transducer TonB [Prevotella sp.]|nr:energy transducer TonB [Prevotella sp.]
MEQKKTSKADIEKYRLMGFLIGIVVALSLLLAAFEFSYGDSIGDIFDGQDSDLLEELDIVPVMPQQNLVALKENTNEAQSDVIVAAEDDTEPLKEDADNTVAGQDDQSEGETIEKTPETAVSPLATDMNDNPLNVRVVEELPQFPGGAVEMMKWLTKNLKYPENAQRRKKQGRVVAQFMINTDGSVSDIKIIKSIDPQLDREALRVLKMMPAWKPGMQEGKPCRTMVVVPVWFRL